MIKLFVMMILTISTQTFAYEDMDSIIDQLERNLIEQEQQLLNIKKEAPQGKYPKRTFKYNATDIKANDIESDKLSNVTKRIRDISESLEIIKNDYRSLKTRFAEEEQSTNTSITLQPSIDGLKGYKRIKLTIDGVSIMDFVNDGSMWTPKGNIRIFNSHLPYGEHSYNVTTTLMIDQNADNMIKPLYTKQFRHSGKFKINEKTKKKNIPLELKL